MRDPRSLRPAVVAGSGGRRVLRLLLPRLCQYSCAHCPFALDAAAQDRDASLESLARLAVRAYRAGLCDGIFVLAGLPAEPDRAMENLLAFVELLRLDLGYRGYLHVKAVGGASARYVERLVRLADRISYAHEPACERALHEIRGLNAHAVREDELKAAAEVQRARTASARRSPPLLPVRPGAAARAGSFGAERGAGSAQGSLFEPGTLARRGAYPRQAASRAAS